MDYISLLLLFMFAHFLADYPLQGDFLAKAKNPNTQIPGVPWFHALFAHAGIHAGAVYIVSGNIYMALFELVAHFVIDYLKCIGKLDFNQDQCLHFICKWAYVVLLIQPF